ncbi:MAG: hypothetical protein IH848_06030 [Acidobacteria bacterium]|nr:hypothetical protein [Acidobacteriota bacterium]
MFSAHIRSIVGASMVVFLMNACASIPKTIYTQEEIVAQMEARVSAEMRDQIVIPFEIDDEIRQLVVRLHLARGTVVASLEHRS